jgi:hypothetical protein
MSTLIRGTITYNTFELPEFSCAAMKRCEFVFSSPGEFYRNFYGFKSDHFRLVKTSPLSNQGLMFLGFFTVDFFIPKMVIFRLNSPSESFEK